MAERDGGSAFPRDATTGGSHDGMSLRDWFAGQAIAGVGILSGSDERTAAREAYAIADAMLAERSKP